MTDSDRDPDRRPTRPATARRAPREADADGRRAARACWPRETSPRRGAATRAGRGPPPAGRRRRRCALAPSPRPRSTPRSRSPRGPTARREALAARARQRRRPCSPTSATRSPQAPARDRPLRLPASDLSYVSHMRPRASGKGTLRRGDPARGRAVGRRRRHGVSSRHASSTRTRRRSRRPRTRPTTKAADRPPPARRVEPASARDRSTVAGLSRRARCGRCRPIRRSCATRSRAASVDADRHASASCCPRRARRTDVKVALFAVLKTRAGRDAASQSVTDPLGRTGVGVRVRRSGVAARCSSSTRIPARCSAPARSATRSSPGATSTTGA